MPVSLYRAMQYLFHRVMYSICGYLLDNHDLPLYRTIRLACAKADHKAAMEAAKAIDYDKELA